MDMNIDAEGLQSIRQISAYVDDMISEIIFLRSSLSSATSGFQSVHYDSVAAAVNNSVDALNRMAENLMNAQSFVDKLVEITEEYLELRYE
jgi:hypothetical protein